MRLRLLPQAYRWASMTTCWADVTVVVELVHRPVVAAFTSLVRQQRQLHFERRGRITVPECSRYNQSERATVVLTASGKHCDYPVNLPDLWIADVKQQRTECDDFTTGLDPEVVGVRNSVLVKEKKPDGQVPWPVRKVEFLDDCS